MDSSMIGKVEKAKRYSLERERVSFSRFTLRFHGDHRTHEITFRDGIFHCTCDYFAKHAACSHSMAMERMLDGMLASKIEPFEAAAS